MEQFSQWFINFFEQFISNIIKLIVGFFVGIYNFFIGYPINYAKYFLESSKTFTFIDWSLSIVFIFVFIILVIIFMYVLIQYLIRYFRFTKIEYEKMELIYRINNLEKRNKYYSNNVGTNRNIPRQQTGQVQPTNNTNNQQMAKNSRFTKLNLIDEKYKFSTLPTLMTEKDRLSLSALVSHFVNYASFHHGLYYSEEIASIFIAGLATSKILILEGISGTGKTSLPYVFGKFIKNDASIISVQPSWRDRFEMMGYYNEFTKKFNETEFLSSVYEATYRTDINLIVLDEMNLARVEYYFADFLSLLELPNSDEWLVEIVPEQLIGDPLNLKEGKIKIPQNVWFVGTANNDDSTFGITDKVYDRASSIVMNQKAVPFNGIDLPNVNISYEYLNELFIKADKEHQVSNNNLVALEKLDNYISETFQITFGNRIMNQIKTFIPVYVACGRPEIEGIDYIIARKIIRKFETLNLPFLKRELEELVGLFDTLFGRDNLKESKEMVLRFIKQV